MKEEKKYFYEIKSDEWNILSIVLLIIMIGLTFLFIKLFNIPFNLNGNNLKWIYIFLFPYLVIHEILHSIGYVVNGAKFKRITLSGNLPDITEAYYGKKTIQSRNKKAHGSYDQLNLYKQGYLPSWAYLELFRRTWQALLLRLGGACPWGL